MRSGSPEIPMLQLWGKKTAEALVLKGKFDVIKIRTVTDKNFLQVLMWKSPEALALSGLNFLQINYEGKGFRKYKKGAW